MNLNIPSLDLEIEEAGKWFPYRGNIRLRIARMNNDSYLAGAAEMYSLLDEGGASASVDKQGAFMLTLYARYILKDWEGVVDSDSGDVVAYTHEDGETLLGDPRYKDLLSFVLEKSRSINEYWEDKTAAAGEE
jgi:hypothetical protein